jgi:hypothetical protein
MLYNVVADHFNLSRDVVYIALNYMDRYCVASNKVIVDLLRNKNRFQLLAMASLCLAIKVHGDLELEMDMDDNIVIISSDTDTAIQTSWAGSITSAATATTESWIIDTILQLGRGNFTAEQLKTMEVDVLQRLQWLLHPPTPQVFISYYFDEFCPWDEETIIELKDLSLFIIELSVHDYYFVPSKPSIVTLAALYNAAQMLDSASASSIRTMTENDDNDDDYSSSSSSSLSSTWLMDLQHDLLRHNNNNNNDDYCKEVDNINACRERLKKLYANTDAKIEDFLRSNHYYPYSSLTNSNNNSNNNNNNTDEICREPSPTSVMNN